jgi:hypothetical protein
VKLDASIRMVEQEEAADAQPSAAKEVRGDGAKPQPPA